MISSYLVIDAINDSLSKPRLHPRAREILEERLQHHLDEAKRKRGRVNQERIRNAAGVSAKVRAAKAEEKRRIALPFVLKLRKKGLTFREIEDHPRLAGITNYRGVPYSADGLAKMVREHGAQKQA